MARPQSMNDADVLAALRAFVAEHGYTPTVGTLAQQFDVSERTMIRYLRRLEAAGHLTRQWPGVRNGLTLSRPKKGR